MWGWGGAGGVLCTVGAVVLTTPLHCGVVRLLPFLFISRYISSYLSQVPSILLSPMLSVLLGTRDVLRIRLKDYETRSLPVRDVDVMLKGEVCN